MSARGSKQRSDPQGMKQPELSPNYRDLNNFGKPETAMYNRV